METKKDIYNLWVQYTTKNEETFFRQFIAGFVAIWEKQLSLNLDDPPLWSEIKNDSGPHLNRLPEELLPAIGKFLIIARDGLDTDEFTSEKLVECDLLLKCLTIICRHFENIVTISNTEFISQSIAITSNLIQKRVIVNGRNTTLRYDEISFIKSFCNFLEVLYDPFLTWRNFLVYRFCDFKRLSYHPIQLSVEIVPFIYDCFQLEKIYCLSEIGSHLIHVLGAIISGSQQNALRAICPATVSILISLLSKWECSREIRDVALRLFNIMNIVLQRSSPEQRQIEMLTILQLYLGAIKDLLKTERFGERSIEASFEISEDDDDQMTCIDVNALNATVNNVGDLLCEPISRGQICNAIFEANFLGTLIEIPRRVNGWKTTDLQTLDTTLIRTLTVLSHNSPGINQILSSGDTLKQLFEGLKEHGRPSQKLIGECIQLAFNGDQTSIVNGRVLIALIDWLGDEMNDTEQIYFAENLLKICHQSVMCKMVACQNKTIDAISRAITNHKPLANKCVTDLIKCIEELGKHNIHPIELKNLFGLLRAEVGFEYRKQLLQAIANISHHNLTVGPTCVEYLDIQTDTDGITVPEIRKWLTSSSHGFIFHMWLRLDRIIVVGDEAENESHNYRRQLFNLMTVQGTGFEFFIQKNGNLVVAVSTKKEFLTASVHTSTLLDGRWHSVTISITPPKRPFSYNQVNIYIDATQKLGVTMKFPAFTEPFSYCTIGALCQRVRRISQHHALVRQNDVNESTSPEPSTPTHRGMFPSFMEKSFLPSLVSQVPSILSLPMRNTASLDPNVKSFPLGMQDSIFGGPCCLQGQLGCVVLAEASLNVRSLFEGGTHLSTILANEYAENELGSRYVFCYAPSGCSDGYCIDLAPGNKFNGHVIAKYNKSITVQESINSVGGTFALLPLLEFTVQNEGKEILIMPEPQILRRDSLSPNAEDFIDWEVLPSTAFTEWKLNQNPVSCFICLIRNFISGHELNQENLLKNDAISIIGSLLTQCNSNLIDVNVLMSVQLLVESVQNQIPSPNMELLQNLYTNIVFNFKIWSRTQFQITIGHIQYICTIIKDDRKFFRKKYGIQFFLDTIRQFYAKLENLSLDDGKTIRVSLLGIIKYYLQKELSIKEVTAILSFVASVKSETLVIELLEMLTIHMESKGCKDQIFLLMHEPHTTELLYALLIDRNCGVDLHAALLTFIATLLNTKRVSNRHKASLRLIDTTLENHSIYPGLFSYMLPLTVEPLIVLMLLDQTLSADSEVGYSGTLCLIHHLSLADISLKLEVSRRLLTATFTKSNSPMIIAKQTGWQESISRLLIKNAITNSMCEEKESMLANDSTDLGYDYQNDPNDLITFDEKTMELNYQSFKDSSLILTERLQASVTEAANVIESEIKELADSVSEKVVDNFTSVYSVIRQKTHDIHDTLENLALGGHSVDISEEHSTAPSIKLTRTRSSSVSSTEDRSSLQSTSHPPTPSIRDNDSLATQASNENRERSFSLQEESAVDKEEQLVYLVTNILFTVLWRGVENHSGDSWKERGQVMACINLLGLNNELYCSHLTLRLRILEMGVQAALIDLGESGPQNLLHQQNAAQLLRMVYDLVVLDPNEDDSKKCSTKLLDGVLAILDALMVFQQASLDDWHEMTKLCLGLLLKCSHNPEPDIVAMATAKLHGILQSRNSQDPQEIGYLIYSINKALDGAIDVGNSEQYSFLMPVLKALLEKSRMLLSLNTNVPDLPPPSSGPVFFHNFQMYSTSKQWINFMEKKIKPLHDAYQKDIESTLWEPLNTFWAECYEACKFSSQKRAKLQMESRRKFQQKILMPWRMRQSDEVARLNNLIGNQRAKQNQIERRWKSAKRFLNGPRGAWRYEKPEEEFWKLSHHENTSRMRLKLEPSLYHDPHTAAANLRDNTITSVEEERRRLSTDFGTQITAAAVRDILSDEDSILLEEEIRNSSETQQQQESIPDKEKLLISQECELVTLMTKVKGRLDVTTNHIIFINLDTQIEDAIDDKYSFRFPIAQLREIHLRKYNLRRSALEIFLVDQTSYFLNFTTKTRNKIFSRILGLNPPNILYGSGRSPSELLKASGLTQKWVNREISNFDYLIHLNTIAGRSYNDLSQYPVFPWILADYTSDILDLTDPKSFRDLSKPIGVVNPKNEVEVRAKYEGFEDPSGIIPKFHYGTHYSNSAGVLHYMIRVEPFTSLHIDLQSGRFDVADRQFHSIPQTWKLLMDNPNDVKELIPEFFYFPEFLKNMNKFDLGVLQITKERVDDVILPKWARTAEDFIAIHRRALESEYVSQNLHHWIDLIFGYKQKGPKAADALNVFYYCSYEGAVDLDKIANQTEREAVEGMINNFGQIPSQLMREPHPKRLNQEETIFRLLRLELKRPDLTQFLDRITNVTCEMSTEKDPVIFLSTPRSPPRSFLQTSPDMLVSITKSGILGCHSWISHDKDKGFILEIDATTMNLKNRKRLIGPFHPAVTLNSQLFAVSLDGKLLYAGGIWDNSLRVFNVNRGKMVATVIRHSDVITCLALDNCGSFLVTGSKDCTCIVWSINSMSYAGNFSTTNTQLNNLGGSTSGASNSQNQNNSGVVPKPLNTLYGHDDAVTCVSILTELDIVVSGSQDGTVNVHTIHEGQYVRTLNPLGCTGLNIEISFITLSYQGHIVFSALDDTSHSVHVFSINGVNLGSKYVSGRVTGLTTAQDNLIVADDAGDLTMSRFYGLKPVFYIPLHIPVQTVVVTLGNTHMLAPLRDGRLAVIGVSTPTAKAKHSVLNV